jgi:membrane protease YdiL (CAAX protease family)
MRDIFVGSDGLRAGWGLLLYAVLFFVLLFASGALIHVLRLRSHPAQPGVAAQSASQSSEPSASTTSGLLPASTVLISEGISLFAVVVASWLMSKIERRPNSIFGLGGKRRLRNLLTGLAWGVVLLSLLVFTLRATGLLAFDARQLFGRSALRFGAIWFAAFLLVGLFEEYFFRGYLQFTLARGINGIYGWLRTFSAHAEEWSDAGSRSSGQAALGFWVAALLLSFGFGFVHRTNTGESPIGLLSAALIAIVFCLSLWRTGSLWWAIGFHTAWDWAQSFLYGVADSGIVVQGHLLGTHPVGRPIFSGGLTGPEGSLFILPTLAFTAAVILLTLPKVRLDNR